MATRGRPRTFDRADALRQAQELFWERGYEGVSIGELTRALGLSPTSLYAAFGSKEQLFREAIERYDAVEGAVSARALAEPTARAAIEALLRVNAAAYADPGTPLGCMVVLSATNTTAANDRVGAFLAERRAADRAAVLERIRRGVEDGDLPADTDAAALAGFVSTVHEGLSIAARDGAAAAALDAVVDVSMRGWDALAGREG